MSNVHSSKVQQASKTSLLYVNSKDASYTSQGDYYFVFPRNAISEAKNISVYSYNFVWSWTNIDFFSNTFLFKEGAGATLTVTLPIGNYSVLDLQNALASLMTAAGTQTYTVTYNTVTNLYSFSAPTTAFTILYTGNTTADLIGLTSNVTSSGIPKTLTLQRVVDLLPSKELQIWLPGSVQTTTSSGSEDQSIIQLISLGGYSYGSEIREVSESIQVPLTVKNLSTLTVSIVDQSSYTPNFAPNQPFSIVFSIERY